VSSSLQETAGRPVKGLVRRAIEAPPGTAWRRALLAAEGSMYRWPFYRPLARPGRRELLMTYDLRCSAPSFGDFMQFALVARLYQLRGVRTRIVVIDGELRDDHVALGPDVVANHLARAEQYPEIAKAVSLGGMVEVERMPYAEFAAREGELGKRRGRYPSRRRQLGRRGVYARSWGILESVLRQSSPAARQRFALTAAEVGANLALSPPEGRYLTVAVRAASLAGHDRDITAKELEGWLERIRAHFPAEPVWIVSDQAGTEAIRSWGLDFGLSYAQDFGRSFAAHTLLALGSCAYLQLRGGGITTGLMWGATPLFLKADRSNELTRWVEGIYADGYRFPWGSPLSVWYAPDSGDVDAQLEEFLRSLLSSNLMARSSSDDQRYTPTYLHR
jgi:hypothetical protein